MTEQLMITKEDVSKLRVFTPLLTSEIEYDIIEKSQDYCILCHLPKDRNLMREINSFSVCYECLNN